MPLLRVCIVGCGNIAGGFDAGKPGDAPPLTHAGAFTRDGGFEIAACVDPDAQRREAFQAAWNVPLAFSDLDAVPSPHHYDVISVCSPTAVHAQHLRAALALEPALVFAEKPVTPSAADTEALVRAYGAAGCLLAVNHTRRWAPDVVRLADELRAGEWGAIRSATGVYNKGVLNNGAHLVDLLHLLIGPSTVVAAGGPVADFWPDDPTIAALLTAGDGVPVALGVGHAADYALFELEIVTARGVIAMEQGGLSWRVRRSAESPHFAGYRALDAGQVRPGEYARAMSLAVANIREAVESGAALASTGETALDAQRVCERIRILSNG